MRSNSAVRMTRVEHSRRFLRELDEAPGGNNLQYILKCPCIPFFGNQGLHNEIMLGGNGERSRVMCEGSSYNVCHSQRILSYSFFLLNKYDSLLGNVKTLNLTIEYVFQLEAYI